MRNAVPNAVSTDPPARAETPNPPGTSLRSFLTTNSETRVSTSPKPTREDCPECGHAWSSHYVAEFAFSTQVGCELCPCHPGYAPAGVRR